VRTLFLETGNSRQTVDVVRPRSVAQFLDAAHAAGLRVIAWYLPSLTDTALDLRRALAAIRFVTAKGARFDSFALDIESSDVTNVARRDARLLRLSAAIRKAVGPAYALGAIVPSPVGMQLHPRYWPGFPFQPLARLYDVFLPMAYFTYRVHGTSATYERVVADIAGVRAGIGDPAVPIHVIGGLSGGIGAPEASGFAQAVADCGTLGFSVYEFPTTRRAVWGRLADPPAVTLTGAC
jgi:hypothetical protein